MIVWGMPTISTVADPLPGVQRLFPPWDAVIVHVWPAAEGAQAPPCVGSQLAPLNEIFGVMGELFCIEYEKNCPTVTCDGALTLIDVERRTISTDREALAGFHVPFPVVLALSVHVPAEEE